MFLEKLEIQGFKSFANKNKLAFPGFVKEDKRGITGIVGPNGAGKSNISDSIRWVLGEQSMKSLRAKQGEDVIFSGTKSKGKSNFAEVSLFLNNQDEKHGGVGRQAPIPYSELILTRRVYRSGENEYLVNNNKTKLSEIQMLLAKANFGQNTYSVIGQGMVENFLKVSPRERKDFFDEATGIKEFQIKRDSSLNKLIGSYKNLQQAEILTNEIEPRLNSLTRQVNKLQKKDNLEKELKNLQLRFFKYKWHKLNTFFLEFNESFSEIETKKEGKEKKLVELNEEFKKIQEGKGVSEEFNHWSKIISGLQEEREKIIRKIVTIDAQQKLKLENSGNFDISWLKDRSNKILEETEKQEKEREEELNKTREEKGKLNKIEEEIKKTLSESKELNDKLMNSFSKSSSKNSGEEVQINLKLKTINKNLSDVNSLESIEEIKKVLEEINKQILEIIELTEDKDEEKEKEQIIIKEKINKLSQKINELNNKKNESNVKINTLNQRINFITDQINKLKEEKRDINKKIEKYSQSNKDFNNNDVQDKKILEEDLKDINEKITNNRGKLNNLGKIENEKKEKLNNAQKRSQELQEEINNLNNRLNNTRIEATKYETKLEDLEIEIRNELSDYLKEIKTTPLQGAIDSKKTRVEIEKIKNQLSQIGGIDSETEKEYIQTKEKYTFLTEQIDDLKKAVKSLEGVIRELDVSIKEKFNKEFKTIHRNFEKYFKVLFNGGEAKITSIAYEEETDEEDEGSNMTTIKNLSKSSATGIEGIDIQVHPPGKKITSISMLSGGEKALTAIALICAIIKANPSPFVVLDEVDAALDEANSERFAQILNDLSYNTQFIVITHNRASMHKADILYGVTMKNNGVSNLVSIKIEDKNIKK
ncbi:chromosome segregation protein SMC [bacterium]|nr:chromosome segregation protein SMC [bacterium]